MSEQLEERKKKFLELFVKNKNIWVFVILAILLLLAWQIRTSNLNLLKDVTTNDYTLGPDLDPFLFLRYAQIINDNGSLPVIDELRYVPLGFNTAEETKLLPYLMVYFHKLISPITNKSLTYSAVLFPAFMFLLTIVAFFLFIRKVFEEHKWKNAIALIAVAFLIVSPSLLPRTIAGIPEKESAGFFFMFMAFYFFLSSWKSENNKTGIILGVLAGISTSLMGLIWGGWIYIFVTIGLFAFTSFILGNFDKHKLISYSLWFFVSLFMTLIFSDRFTLKGLLTSTSSGLCFGIFAFMLVDYIIYNTKIKEFSIIQKARTKIPDKFLSIGISIILGIILASIFINISFVPDFISDITGHLTQPYTDRLSYTVAENRQPYFSDWKESFGPTSIVLFGSARTIPALIFWLFFAGSIFLFYETVKNIRRKERLILLVTYIIFLFALIFSKYSTSSSFNGQSVKSMILYLGSFVLLGFSFIYVYYNYYKENMLDEFKKLNYSYLFLIAYFIPGLLGARSAIRLLLALVPPVAGILGFFSIYSVERGQEKRNDNAKIIAYILVGLILVSVLFSFYNNYKISSLSAKQMAPSIYTQQWQKAMSWVRDNTTSDAVFAHWWDYGYWVQSLGERKTVLDGGNVIPYWDHLLGRHVLTANSEKEALEFLYTHNATHLLIDPTDIGKYSAYSMIGSDENYDRYSWIGNFNLDEQSIQERKNDTLFVYRGGVALDEDYKFNENGKEIFLPSGATGVGAFLIPRDTITGEFKQPTAIFVYQGVQYNIPLRYLYYNNSLKDFKSGYNGSAFIVPSVISTSQGQRLSEFGSALFLSERNMRALWVRLYLFNEAENFELVHAEQDVIVDSIKAQANIGEFLNYYDIRGPIKIWKINYPSDIKANPEYLKKEYPDSVRLHTLA